MTIKVWLARDAEADLERRFNFPLRRELSCDGGDLALPAQAIAPRGPAALLADAA